MHEPIIASLSTYPPRFKLARKVIDRIAPQVSFMRVYVNDRHGTPEWEGLPVNVGIYRGHKQAGEIGGYGKFYRAGKLPGYHITVDDDILYPEDYAARLTKEIMLRGNKVVCGYHGCLLPDREVSSYYGEGQLRKSHFRRPLSAPRPAHLLGSGTLGYHTSALRVGPLHEDFPILDMGDIWFALLCERQGVPRIILPRKADYLMPMGSPEGSVYQRYQGRDVVQTAIINNNTFRDVH